MGGFGPLGFLVLGLAFCAGLQVCEVLGFRFWVCGFGVWGFTIGPYIITSTIFGAPYYNYSRMGPKTRFQ